MFHDLDFQHVSPTKMPDKFMVNSSLQEFSLINFFSLFFFPYIYALYI